MRMPWSAFTLALLLACGKAPEPPAKPVVRDVGKTPTPKALEQRAPEKARIPPVARDWEQIASEKTLRVLFTFNSTGYFVYRGETLGYEYELMQRFAKASNLRLVPVVVRDSRTLFDRLNAGDGDVVAAQLIAPSNESEVLVTDGLYSTPPVIVQRGAGSPARGQSAAVAKAMQREDNADGRTVEIRARLITTPPELAGQRVHLSESSPYRGRLLELSTDLPDDIEVIELEQSADQLVEHLAEGEIGYTVAAENFANLKAGEYTNLIVKPVVGPPQQVVWAVRRNAPELHGQLDAWLDEQRKSGLLNIVYRKYFLDRTGFIRRAKSEYLAAKTGKLSPYDDWFREYSRTPGWDWRLVAAQAYQESRLLPNAKSWAGAVGLMQIMPRTARELKINPRDTRQNIEGACRYLWKMDDALKDAIPRESERIKFILGSYNVGLGHVQDARRLAVKHGDDPSNWDDVAYWLIRKSKRSVYNDPVVKYGFARGTEPVNYVAAILDRFENYKQFVEKDPAAEPETTPE
jgi:membrane-bound lytic murein transglycosylase F